MAVLNDLIAQIENAELRRRIEAEVERLNKQKKFGLVFEDHLPECTPLYDIPVKVGSTVALRAGQVNEIYKVLKIEGEEATCVKKDASDIVTFNLNDLVSVAEFGEAIYPYLKPLDSVCNAPDSDLWHTLIEADNYHALQLLEYLYAGKVDCIYIDPPYNTGAKDWKYNNDYVDNTDSYRHSKWLSMMAKRLRLSKKLLKNDGVLIATIDEHEVHHLRTLLEEIFPECQIQMVTDVINPKGVAQNYFARVEEYIIFVFMPEAKLSRWKDNMLGEENVDEVVETVTWASLLRRGNNSMREDRPKMYYPVLIDVENNRVVRAGDILPLDEHPTFDEVIDGYQAAWPVRTNLSEGHWSVGPQTLDDLISKGFVKLGGYDEKRKTWAITYLFKKQREQIDSGEIVITGYNEREGHVEVAYNTNLLSKQVKTVWNRQSHDAGTFGSTYIANILNSKRFTFPKSLYAVRDAIGQIVGDNPNALILDYFAGSGTTLQAVNLLNAEDGGARRCILVTNNEVSVDEAKSLKERGFCPGDDEWQKLGVAQYVTWPRTVCTIKGADLNGIPLKGDYLTLGNAPLRMDAGFNANAVFFKLGFLDKNAVALGRQFKELVPVLWMKAGAIGECPVLEEDNPGMLVLPKNKFAVLADERRYLEFVEELDKYPEIETVYIVTDSERAYRDMIAFMDGKNTYQLYRDYLDNFRINSVRR